MCVIRKLIVLILSVTDSFAQRDFRYHGPLGPQFWPRLFPTCAGNRQSPIAIHIEETKLVNFEPFKFVDFDKVPDTGTVTNNEHTAMVTLPLPRGATITGGDLPGEFEFLNYHFHWGSDFSRGSEHIIDGTQHPLEVHMMLWNRNYLSVEDAIKHKDGIAVLAAHYRVGHLDNPILTPVIEALRRVRRSGTSTSFQPGFRLLDVLPLDIHSYYRYMGSLTSPDCFESVIWTVFTSVLPISEQQLIEFRGLLNQDNEPLVDNFRPVQPLNSRVVYRNGIPKIPDFCFIPFLCPLIENFLQILLLLVRSMIDSPLLLG